MSPFPATDIVQDFTQNEVLLKIFLTPNDPADLSSSFGTVLLKDILKWTTDISLCYESIISHVTDDTGLTLAADPLIFLE